MVAAELSEQPLTFRMASRLLLISLTALSLLQACQAQTFQRLGACPSLGCIFPPDQYGIL